MQNELVFKIECWLNRELKRLNYPLPVDYFLNQSEVIGISMNRLEEIIDESLAQGRFYAPYPGYIDRVNLYGPTFTRKIKVVK